MIDGVISTLISDNTEREPWENTKLTNFDVKML